MRVWWGNREANGQAWRYDFKAELERAQAAALEDSSKAEATLNAVYNLDRKHPNSQEDLEHLPPEELVKSILAKEQRIAEIMREIEAALGEPVTV